MTALEWLISLRPALPASIERSAGDFKLGELNPSNSEVRRWLKNKAVLVNGEVLEAGEEMDFPVFSLVFFPKGNRRTTVV